jgi:hypothetical protein
MQGNHWREVMTTRAIRGLSILALLLLALAGAAHAAEGRRIVTTQDADYFGFDLRSTQNVTLDQCEAECLGDSAWPEAKGFAHDVCPLPPIPNSAAST